MEIRLEVEKDTYEMLERRAQNHGFESIEEYSGTILKTVMDELEVEDEHVEIEDRLEDLGYLS